MNPSGKKRLDQILLDRGLFPSRARAQASILEGKVRVHGRTDLKAGDKLNPDVKIEILEEDMPYVSRGGIKLAGALEDFNIDVSGFEVLDIGASTGGFTDCLLKSGAKHVTALDVGKGLIAWSLRTDPRVKVIEELNARYLKAEDVPGPFDLIVIDVSFISLKLILPKLPERVKIGGLILALIKPQFEAGRGKAPGGIVKDDAVVLEVLESFKNPSIFGENTSCRFIGFKQSRIEGQKGNREYFGLWKIEM